MPKVLYWAGLTASQPFNTGVQRVTRCLGKGLQELAIELVPIKWNDQERRVTSLNESECEHLAKWGGPKCAPVEQLPRSRWLILPEITYPLVPPGSNVAAWAKSHGIKTAAVFYDMIPLRTKELYDAETLDGLSVYWRSFAETDLALPISQTVAPDLADWLTSQRLRVPSSVPILLSGEVPDIARETKINMPSGQGFRLLAIGTWEPRKNYPCILRAIGKARQESGMDIQITIAGRHARKEFPELHDEIERLARDLGQHVVSLRSQVSDSEMSELTRESHATIFGSWLEGFGLPVLESLWQGKPCICHDGSALAEIAPGGGTIMVDMQSEDSVAGAIARVASDRAELQRLYREASERPLRTWADYARDVYTAVRNHAPLSAPLDFLRQRRLVEEPHPIARMTRIEMDANALSRFTQVGEFTGSSLRTDGRSGYLVFGPYADLAAGSYSVTISGFFRHALQAVVDVAGSSGTHQYFVADLSTLVSGTAARFRFTLAHDVAKVELRIAVGQATDIEISGYQFERE
ncbi:glycosyltransferase [Caballeronia sp. dw_19]|uniref:glycosyltransferase n=1 Tax=Caballeronia sp. dw_19 TaxID=2719791 RepID=UPI001BD4ED52|nr:glycosyltransferase [Caballeronia sp. dw_19]